MQQLPELRRRYLDLSAYFKAVWTFHQSMLGMARMPVKGAPDEVLADFQGIYNDLKGVSQKLNRGDHEAVRERLDAVEEHLRSLAELLMAQDNRVSTSLLRQFLRRVKSDDEKMVLELARFYLYSHRQRAWSPDEVDKLDLLLSRLGMHAEHAPESTPGRPGEALGSLWLTFRPDTVDAEALTSARRRLTAVQREIERTDTFEQLEHGRVLERYRELKHSLGPLFLVPSIIRSVIACNQLLGRRVQQLSRNEADRIARHLERIDEFDREVALAEDLGADYEQFQEDLVRYEEGIREDNLRVGDVTRVRQHVESILPRLNSRRKAAAGATAVPLPALAAAGERADLRSLLRESEIELLEAGYLVLIAALEQQSDALASPVEVARSLRIGVQVTGREVLAFRRLVAQVAADAELEAFLLKAAALRATLRNLFRELADGDEPAPQGLELARRQTGLADAYVHRLSHDVDQAILGGELDEARALQALRMLLQRELAELWLLLHRPE